MTRIAERVILYTFGAHKFKAHPLRAEVSDRLSSMLTARNEVTEISFHVFQAKCFIHPLFNPLTV